MVELDETMTYDVYYEIPAGWGKIERLTSAHALELYDGVSGDGATYAEIVCIEDGEIKDSMGTRTRD